MIWSLHYNRPNPYIQGPLGNLIPNGGSWVDAGEFTGTIADIQEHLVTLRDQRGAAVKAISGDTSVEIRRLFSATQTEPTEETKTSMRLHRLSMIDVTNEAPALVDRKMEFLAQWCADRGVSGVSTLTDAELGEALAHTDYPR